LVLSSSQHIVLKVILLNSFFGKSIHIESFVECFIHLVGPTTDRSQELHLSCFFIKQIYASLDLC
jgi:hypothetical protein